MKNLLSITILISFLFIQINSFAQLYSEFNSEDRNIQENNRENNFSGKIFFGDKLLEHGKVYLLTNSKASYSSNSNCEVQNGQFTFSELEIGKYILYVIPEFDYDFLFYPKYLPTYSGGSYKWEDATDNTLNKGIDNFQLGLYSYSEPFYGHCSISGRLFFNSSYYNNRRVDIPVPILLFNENKEPMDFQIAEDTDGSYRFVYLPEGKYYIHPEIPGIKTEDYEVNVKENSENPKIDFRIDRNNILPENNNEQLNPVVDQNTIKIFFDKNQKMPLICELINIAGKSVFKNIYTSNNIYINTSGMAAGIYLLRVRTFDNSVVKTAKVYLKNS